MKQLFFIIAISVFLSSSANADLAIFLCEETNWEVGGNQDNVRCDMGTVQYITEQDLIDAVAAQVNSGSITDLDINEIEELAAAVLLLFVTAFGIRVIRKLFSPNM